MTFFLAVMDPEKEQFRCVNAGHGRPYLLLPTVSAQPDERAQFALTPVGLQTSAPLGYDRGTAYSGVETHPWPVGAKLFLYTDGLIDSENFGRNKLRKTIAANGQLNARALLSKIMQEHRGATPGIAQLDDITVVICESVVEV